MKDKQAKYPQLRFKGFTDPWVQRKLSELASVTDTKHATAPVIDVVTKYRMIRTSSVRNGFLNENKTDSVTEETYEKWSERIRLQEGDVVFSREAPIGESAVIPKSDNNFFLGQRMVGIRTNENLNPAFLNETFLAPRFRKEVNVRNAESTTVANFGIPDIKRYEINVPSIEEQEKIGKLLDGVNNLIAANQHKLDLLKEQKKGYLQKLFPENGSKFPQLRFAGFADAWEQRKLGEFVIDYVEKTTTQNQFPVLTSSQKQGVVLQETYFASRQVTTDNNIGYYVLPRGYFTFRSRSDNDVFVFNRNDLIDKGIISYFYPVFTLKNADSDFFLERINNGIKRQLAIQAEGTGQHVLSMKKFRNIISMFPSFEEQQKIGSFFKELDDTIALHQRKLEKLQELKKGYLQKMFC